MYMLVLVLLCMFCVCDATLTRRYVGLDGSGNSSVCGSESLPCSDLQTALRSVSSSSQIILTIISQGAYNICGIIVPDSTKLIINATTLPTHLLCASSSTSAAIQLNAYSSLALQNVQIFVERALVRLGLNSSLDVDSCSVSSRSVTPLIVFSLNSSVDGIFLKNSEFKLFQTFWSSGQIIPGKSLFFDASNCTFEGFSSVAFALLPNQNISFSDCIFQNSNLQALSITNEAQSARFLNCQFRNLSLGSWIVSGGSVYAENCSFTFAKSPQIALGTMGSTFLEVRINGSVFANNNASGVIDGLNALPSHRLYVEKSIFANNTMPSRALSGVVFRNAPKFAEFRQCVFVDNDFNVMLFSFDSLTVPFTFRVIGCEIIGSPFFSLNGRVHVNSSIEIVGNSFRNIYVRSAEGVLNFASVMLSIEILNSSFEDINSGRSSVDSFSTVYISGSLLVTFKGCLFRNISGYQATTIQITNSKLNFISSKMERIYTIADGAGIYSSNSDVLIRFCEFNFLEAAHGAVLYIVSQGTANLTNSLISNCLVFVGYGVVYGGPESIMAIDGVVFTNLKSGRKNLGIRTTSSTLFLSNSFFNDCVAVIGPILNFQSLNFHMISNVTFQNSVSPQREFIYILETPIEIFNLTIRNSSSSRFLRISSKKRFYMLNSFFYQNTAFSATRGSLIDFELAEQVVIENCTFIENKSIFGGVFYIPRGNQILIENCVFLRNKAERGGVLYIEKNEMLNLTLKNSFFSENQAELGSDSLDCYSTSGSGGVFFVVTFSPDAFFKSIQNCTFVDNFAEFYGGIVSVKESVSPFSLQQFSSLLSYSSGNKAQFYGDLIGTPWNVFRATLLTPFILSESSYHIRMVFFDQLNQTALGFACFVRLSQFFSNPEEYFITNPSFLFGSIDSNLSYIYTGSLSFFRPLNPFPLINETALVGLEVSISDSTLGPVQLNLLEVQLCNTGNVLISDPYSYYKCQQCSSGSYVQFSEDAFSCRFCPLGKYSFLRATICLDCDPGSVSNQIAAGSCIKCPKGSFVETKGKTVCLACNIGKFQNDSGKTLCFSCPEGSVTLQDGANSLSDCICPSGKYGSPWLAATNLAHPVCNQCIESDGIICRENNSIPFVFPGYWRDAKVYVAKLCFPEEACKETESRIVTVCAEGYEGQLCGDCVFGNTYRSFGLCKPCSSKVWTLVVLVFFILCVLIFLAYSIFQSNSVSRVDIRIMVAWIQFFAVFSRLGNTIPKPLDDILLTLSIFNLDFNFFAISCIQKIDFWAIYTIQVFSPLIILLVLFTLSVVKKLFQRYKTSSYIKEKVKVEASPFERAYSMFLFILTSLFTMIVSSAFSPFRCFRQIDGSYTLIPKPSENCYESSWNSNIWVISFALLFILLVPLSLLLLLRNYRGKFQSNAFVWRYGLLTSIYKEKYYYWELVSMLRKTFIVVLVDLLSNYSNYVKSFILIVFLVSWMSFEAWIQPYKHEGFSGALAYMWQLLAMFFLLANVLVFTQDQESERLVQICSYLIIVGFALLIVLNIGNIFRKRIFDKKNINAKEVQGMVKNETVLRSSVVSLKSTIKI